MEKKDNVVVDPAVRYRLNFPFNNVKYEDVEDYIETLEQIYDIRDKIQHTFSSPYFFEVITMSLRFLIDNQKVDLKGKGFVDLFCSTGETCLYASPFGFSENLGIMYESSSLVIMKQEIKKFSLKPNVQYRIGSMQDYFPEDCFLFFADISELWNSVFDEGILFHLIVRLSKPVLPGSYFIVVTSMENISQEFLSCYGLSVIVVTTVESPGIQSRRAYFLKKLKYT